PTISWCSSSDDGHAMAGMRVSANAEERRTSAKRVRTSGRNLSEKRRSVHHAAELSAQMPDYAALGDVHRILADAELSSRFRGRLAVGDELPAGLPGVRRQMGTHQLKGAARQLTAKIEFPEGVRLGFQVAEPHGVEHGSGGVGLAALPVAQLVH